MGIALQKKFFSFHCIYMLNNLYMEIALTAIGIAL